MNYNRIFDKFDEMVKTEYPKNYKVKVVFNQEKTFNGFTELTIELVDEDYNKVVYHKYLKEINLEIQKISFSKYITNLKFFLGKIVRKIFLVEIYFGEAMILQTEVNRKGIDRILSFQII